jgi:hypothetical protein
VIDKELFVDFSYSPTLIEFLACTEPYSITVGPVGSGKTVAHVVKPYLWALEQEPGPDNVRYFKAAIVRNTLPELMRTTIETYTSIFTHKLFGDIRRSSPLSHRISWEADGPKGGKFEQERSETGLGLRWVPNDNNSPGLDYHVDFFALDRPQQVKSLLSYEATYIYFNEIREIPKAIVDAAGDRVGRFPSLAKGGVMPTKSGVAGDSNPPDETHWLYEFYRNPPRGWIVRRQPPGLVEVVPHHEC